MNRFLFSFLVLLLVPGVASAQEFSLDVTYIDHGPEDLDSGITREVYDIFQSQLRLKGIYSKGAETLLYTSATSFQDGQNDLVGFTIVEGGRLSEPIIESASKHQIWYAGKPEPENPEEARFVRELMTKEVIGNMVHLGELKTFVVPKSQLERTISNYIDQLQERFDCFQSGECMTG